jgi:hypothetical protein
VLSYWQQHAPSRAIAPSSLVNIEEVGLFKMLFWMRYKVRPPGHPGRLSGA